VPQIRLLVDTVHYKGFYLLTFLLTYFVYSYRRRRCPLLCGYVHCSYSLPYQFCCTHCVFSVAPTCLCTVGSSPPYNGYKWNRCRSSSPCLSRSSSSGPSGLLFSSGLRLRSSAARLSYNDVDNGGGGDCSCGRTSLLHHTHRHGNRGSSCSPAKLLAEQLVYPAPQFFCNLQLKVTLQIVRLLLTQKFSKIPQLCPRPHCTLCIPFFEKYILHKVLLWIWLSSLFFTSFSFLGRKIVPVPMCASRTCASCSLPAAGPVQPQRQQYCVLPDSEGSTW